MSTCKAKNPNFCRFHGTAQQSGFEKSSRDYYVRTKNNFEASTSLAERRELEVSLRQAEVAYAATEAGEEELREVMANSDWAEQERLKEVLKQGEGYRLRVEESLDNEGVHTFPASLLDEAQHRVEKANRKLQRAGGTEMFTYEVETYYDTDVDGEVVEMARMVVSHPKISVNGWTFLASVDKLDNGELITKAVPGQDVNEHRPTEFICEHCGSHRKRKATYIIKNENGEYKQVGSSCLQPFLGVSPTQALWALNWELEKDGDFIHRDRSSIPYNDQRVLVEDTVAAALYASDGGDNYISSSSANNFGGESTSSSVKHLFWGKPTPKDRLDPARIEDFREEAKKMIAEATFEGDGDYATNMRTLLAQEYVGPKHIGYVTSVIAAHKRAAWAAQKAEAAASRKKSVGFLADKGEKITPVKAKVNLISSRPSAYAYDKTDHLIILETEDGQKVKWSTTSDVKFNSGDTVMIDRATVKDHGHYNGDDQTIVKNAKISVLESASTSDED